MKVSIITVAYNSDLYIDDCIQSIINQTYKDIEYIVIDGGSTDNTLNIAKKYSEIEILISEKDEGMYHALNKGIELASGAIIGFLHSDDILYKKDAIEKIVLEFKTKNCDAIYSDLAYVKQNNLEKIIRYWKSGKYSITKLKNGWMPPHPTLYVKKKCYDNYGKFDLSYKIAADYDLMLRFLNLYNINISYIPELFVKMRLGGKSNKNIKNIMYKTCDDYRAVRKNKVGGFFTIVKKNLRKIPQFFKK